jgi:nitroreductase
VGLTSIHWRESWKYGERAFRYCHHDAGHAIGSFAVSAAGLGWEAKLLEASPTSIWLCSWVCMCAGQPNADCPAVFPPGAIYDLTSSVVHYSGHGATSCVARRGLGCRTG